MTTLNKTDFDLQTYKNLRICGCFDLKGFVSETNCISTKQLLKQKDDYLEAQVKNKINRNQFLSYICDQTKAQHGAHNSKNHNNYIII